MTAMLLHKQWLEIHYMINQSFIRDQINSTFPHLTFLNDLEYLTPLNEIPLNKPDFNGSRAIWSIIVRCIIYWNNEINWFDNWIKLTGLEYISNLILIGT